MQINTIHNKKYHKCMNWASKTSTILILQGGAKEGKLKIRD